MDVIKSNRIPNDVKRKLDALFMTNVKIGQEQAISSKLLYAFLGLNVKNYSHWCKKNIVNNIYASEKEDWCLFVLKDENYTTGRKSKEYALTPDFTRRLCMGVPDNEMAACARMYFSERHEKLKALEQSKKSFLPKFINRYHVNANKVEEGYFSVIGEMITLVHGQFELVGLVLPDEALDGTEIRPDVSVGITFANYLRKNYPSQSKLFKRYKHLFPHSGVVVNAKQYEERLILVFRRFIRNTWLPKYAPKYLGERYPPALEYLPKLLKSA